MILLKEEEKQIIETGISFWFTDEKTFYVERTYEGIDLPDSWNKSSSNKTKFNSIPNKLQVIFMHQALYGTVSPDTVVSNCPGSFAALYESLLSLKSFLIYEINSSNKYNIRKLISDLTGASYKRVTDIDRCMESIIPIYSKILGEYQEIDVDTSGTEHYNNGHVESAIRYLESRSSLSDIRYDESEIIS